VTPPHNLIRHIYPSPVPEAPRQTIRRDPRSCTWRDGSHLQGGHGSSGGGSSGRCRKHRQAGPWPYFPSRVPRTGNGHEVYRARHKEKQPSVVVRSHRAVDRCSRLQHCHDAVAEPLDLQAGYAAWLDALPESLRGTATAEALQAITDLDLDILAAIAARLRARLTPGPDGSSVLGEGEGLKGYAARTGKPASALDPLALT
jgi:hypothetical protein